MNPGPMRTLKTLAFARAMQAEAAAAEFAEQSAQLVAHMGGGPARLPRIDEFRAKKRRGLLASANKVAAKGARQPGPCPPANVALLR